MTTRLSDVYRERRDADDFAAVEGWFAMLDADELRGVYDALQQVVAQPRQSVSR